MPLKNEMTSTENGMLKEMPPSESTITTTSPSSFEANSVFLTLDANAQ